MGDHGMDQARTGMPTHRFDGIFLLYPNGAKWRTDKNLIDFCVCLHFSLYHQVYMIVIIGEGNYFAFTTPNQVIHDCLQEKVKE